jgi:hypothetical protein
MQVDAEIGPPVEILPADLHYLVKWPSLFDKNADSNEMKLMKKLHFAASLTISHCRYTLIM